MNSSRLIGICGFFLMTSTSNSQQFDVVKIALPNWLGGQLIAYNLGFNIEIKTTLGISALGVDVLHSTTRIWEEDDHGSYRSGKHTHEACFFTIKRVS